jgi:hypothetical protein
VTSASNDSHIEIANDRNKCHELFKLALPTFERSGTRLVKGCLERLGGIPERPQPNCAQPAFIAYAQSFNVRGMHTRSNPFEVRIVARFRAATNDLAETTSRSPFRIGTSEG